MRRSIIFCLIFLGVALATGSLHPVNAGRIAPAASADCNIWWDQVLHDTFNGDYRSVVGPTTPGNTVRLRLRVAQSDITSARVRVWDDRTNTQTYYNMAWDGAFDTDPVTYDWWYADIPTGSQPTILYYFFEINDAPGWCTADQDFYVDNDPKFYGGGYGAMSDGYDDSRSFQLTVYDPAFSVPEWMQRAIVYQIFPDRFRDGDGSNDPPAGRFFYNQAGGTIVRSNQSNWNYTVCDPRGTYSPACPQKYSENFYGGDLAGITQKINQGYFDNLGVTALYLNPIFRSPSNHKYDTADYLTIDPDFGTLADFQALVAAADAHGLRLILDGVFNHTSSDSTYFDRYSRYDAAGNLTSPGGIGTDDNSGACEAGSSSFYPWFYFPDIGNPAKDDGVIVYCANGPGDANQTYEAWYGYSSLPKLQANSTAVRGLIWANGLSSVGPYWVNQGARGWRFDVGGDVDPGLTNDPANDYWEGFRAAVRSVSPDVITLGEEWGDASAWLLGGEWDSVMNYRFRSAVLSWLFTGCSGNGCTGGTVFEDNDSNASSSSGPIGYIGPSQFNARLRSIQEDYPPMAWKAMLNLAGSHDTNRLRFLLRKINNDSDSAAVRRMKEWWIFAFTYAGAPTLYYGDEVGLNHDGVWAGGKWEDDPYNRAPFPWDDTPGSYTADTTDLQAHARKMASIRHSYRALQDGDVQHGLIIDDANKLYGFGRTNGSQTALIALNRDSAGHTATFTGLNAAPYNLSNGTVLVDALNGGTYTVSGGSVSLTVAANWGAVLLEQAKLDTPVAPDVTISLTASEGASPRNRGGGGAIIPALTFDVVLSWPAVIADTAGGRELATSYEVYRDTVPDFTPGPANRIATVTPPPFGDDEGQISYTDTAAAGSTYYYVVRAFNAAGAYSTGPVVGVTQLPLAAGWNLIALPLEPADPAPATVFSSIGGHYDLVFAYDGCDTADPWKKYDPAAPSFVNDLTAVTLGRGVWVRTTAAVTLRVAGRVPGTTSIPLCLGWNLVGYPSRAAVALPGALDASIAGQYDMVYAYDAADPDPWKQYDPNAPPYTNDLTQMGPGWGYWLHATAATTLIVNWMQVNDNAFGLDDPSGQSPPYQSEEAFEVAVFNGQLYVGMEADNLYGARVWRTRSGVSAPGSQSDWEQVVNDAFGDVSNNDHIDSLEPFGGYIYASTAQQDKNHDGTEVWRSGTGDGGGWVQVNDDGFDTNYNENFKDMISFTVGATTWLCGGTMNQLVGAQVWCTDGTLKDGGPKLNWVQKNHDGFGQSKYVKVWSTGVFEGHFYAGTECYSGAACPGAIWRTDGMADGDRWQWEKVFEATVNNRADVVAAFNSYLYIGFEGDSGTEIWRSGTGASGSWVQVNPDGFGDPNNGRLVSDAAAVYNGALYVATFNQVTGTEVWRTADGTTWAQVNSDGFGRADTIAAQLIPFNGHLYAWATNYTVGQKVLRMQ